MKSTNSDENRLIQHFWQTSREFESICNLANHKKNKTLGEIQRVLVTFERETRMMDFAVR